MPTRRTRKKRHGLYERGGYIYWRQRKQGRTTQLPTGIRVDEPRAWQKAKALIPQLRAELDQGVTLEQAEADRVGTVAEWADRYLREHLPHAGFSARYRQTLHQRLAIDGAAMKAAKLGDCELDAVTRGVWRQWLLDMKTGEAKSRSLKTIIEYTNALAALFSFAEDYEAIEESSIAIVRRMIKKERKAKGRSQSRYPSSH